MAKRRIFKGQYCKSNCGGHRAGWNYAKSGGATPSPHSSSFNEGMRQYLRQLPRRTRR